MDDGTDERLPGEDRVPTFRWKDSSQKSRRWLIQVICADGQPELCFLVRRPEWTPQPQDWESLKQRSLERDAHVVILGVGHGPGAKILSRAKTSFRTSKDPVGAPLFYREVILPFLEADHDPSRIRWRFGPRSDAVDFRRLRDAAQGSQAFQFDLYKIAFNEGQGGTPEPLAGASRNGMSNYFARYSPDGRWIVFCKAKSYMLLQPDRELYIIPPAGGAARRLRRNTGRMNSWHTWSPNGKWLVFSSKGWSDYTQLCLTHIDENGDSTPPVLLSHLTAPDRAANILEFVNTSPQAIVQIREQFVQKR